MDFNSLMAKMRELDQPATQLQAAPVEECGNPMMGSMPSAAPMTPPHNPPTLSVNLNAQGMDDIESIMKLMTRVNPDMINQPAPAMPAMDPMAMLTPPGPSISSIGDLGNLDKGPLKMLPDLDKDTGPEIDGDDDLGGMDLDDKSPGDMGGKGPDNISKAQGDLDNDGDHDMDDHDMEKDKPEDEEVDPEDDDIMTHLNKELKPYDDQVAKNKEKEGEEKTDEWANEPEEDYKDVDFMVNKLAGGMNRPKGQHKHSYAGGDNPRAMPESVDLKTSIKNELRSRLAEAKARGAK
jgi:hypothetical protein